MPTIGLVIFEGFQVMGLAALSAFELANGVLRRKAYEIHLLSEAGGPVKSSLGFPVVTERLGSDVHDTTMAIGSLTARPATPALIDYFARASRGSRRIAGVCTGAFTLAEAGLLDGRRATTHWAHARSLQKRFPKTIVEPDRIFIQDGPIWTSAGMTASVDLALALVEDDFGREVAKKVAQGLVVYLRRTGGQSQFSALLELEPKSDRVHRALVYAREHLKNTLSVDELAEAANLSPRQFSRLFRQETGRPPAKAVEQLRLEAARAFLEEGRLSLEEIARESGFLDRDRMRRAFVRAFGQPPQVLKRAADAERPAVLH